VIHEINKNMKKVKINENNVKVIEINTD